MTDQIPEAALAQDKPERKFIWFGDKTCMKLARNLVAAIAEGPGTRLEIEEIPPESGHWHLTVYDGQGKKHDPLDDSHLCPIDCP